MDAKIKSTYPRTPPPTALLPLPPLCPFGSVLLLLFRRYRAEPRIYYYKSGWMTTNIAPPASASEVPAVQDHATTHSCIEFFENARDIPWHSGWLQSSGKTNGLKQSGKRLAS